MDVGRPTPDGGMVLGEPSIDDVEDMVRGDPAAVYAMLLRRLADPLALTDERLLQRLLLVRADLEARRGDPATSARLVREVQAWATEHGDSLVLARCSRLLSSSFLGTVRSDLLRHADRNLYVAKRRGRDRVVATRRDSVPRSS